MILIRRIVEAYLQGGGGGDWRFCIQASSILTDIVKNNLTPGDGFHHTHCHFLSMLSFSAKRRTEFILTTCTSKKD